MGKNNSPNKKASDDNKDNNGNCSSTEDKQRDTWDYIEVLGRPVSAFFTALAIALIGYFGQLALADRETNLNQRLLVQQKEETKRAAQEQDYRLYTELMSRREVTESDLRKDMFTAILSDFFKKADNDNKDISGRLLKLEMLALNFGESLSLSPLFLEMDEDIEKMRQEVEMLKEATGQDRLDNNKRYLMEKEVTAYKTRLHGLAKRVSGWQLSALSSGGHMFEFEFLVEKAMGKSKYTWPDDYVKTEFEENPNGAAPKDLFLLKSSYADHELDNITRSYTFTFSEANKNRKTVKVGLEVQEKDTERDSVTEIEFDLNYFNFPMVDNTRLSKNQRFALIIEDFNENTIKVAGICFRGLHASQRDKPFLDEVIDQLKEKAESHPANKDP